MNVAEKKARFIPPGTLIGKRIAKMDAPEKASGKTRYIHDIDLPGQLYGKILRSARVHARIVSIDTAAAKALPGVHAVITAADIVDQRPIGVAKDHLPLKTDKVRSLRDEVAAVAAESEQIAVEALKLIRVEYEDLPILTDPAEAIKPGAVLIHPEPRLPAGQDALKPGSPVAFTGKPDNIAMRFDYCHGDVVQAEAESDAVVEDTFKLHYVTHCCLGVSGMIADFDSSGNLLMYSNTQVPFLHKREFGEYLNIDPARIRIIQPSIGGGFGSKLDIYPFEVICVFLARAAKRPVKLVFTREEEFISSPTRQPVLLTLRSGCKKDGSLTFRTVHTLHDNGAYTSWGATTPFVMMQTFSSLYRVPNCDYHTTAVYTNNPYAGSFRGYGNLQATFAVEAHMDKLAEAIGMDTLDFRLKNAQEQGEVTGQGMEFDSCGFKECLTIAAERSDFRRKFAENINNRSAPGPIKRGIGIASMLHVGGGAKIYPSDGCGTILKLDDFGQVTLITGASEIGQGSETVLSQLVCEELGLPMSAVTVVNNDTAITPWDVGVHASRTTFIAGNSALGAARLAKAKILAAAAKKFECPAGDLDLRGGYVIKGASGEALVDLPRLMRNMHFQDKAELVMTTYYYEPPSMHQDKRYKGNVSAAYAWASQVVEIEVDSETGIVKMTKITAAHDVGRVLNRLGIEGQIEGGVVMGQGYALTESLIVENGVTRNPSFRDYKLVTAPEIPEMDISFVESMDGEGPQGAKGVGEAPAICVAAATANAIYNATGVRICGLPFTPERVYRALHGKGEKLYLAPEQSRVKRRTILSLEQALSLPYATLRFAQLGWRVIRIESTPGAAGLPGDPNRYIGATVADADRRSYFIAPNVGKEAIALDLKRREGQALLLQMIRELEVDVFCCNTLPRRYKQLGIDYETLSRAKPDLIWAGISAMGPEYPDAPGYDPVIQAMAGYMELTGDPDGPPMLSGVPLIDLKAGDEVYASVMLALAERAETGLGSRIDVSMLQAAASWLITTLPLLDFDCEPAEITRCGNAHRKFIPTNVYPTRDGFIFMAIGSDLQWKRLTEIPAFAPLANALRVTNEGRGRERDAIHREMAAATAQCTTAQIVRDFSQATIPHAPIHDIPAVRAMEAVRSRLTTTRMPGGRTVRMQPMAVDVPDAPMELRFPPKYAQDTYAVLREAGCSDAECAALSQQGIIAG